MRDFLCPNCGQRLAFENSVCLNCGSNLGFDLDARDFVLVGPDGKTERDAAAHDVRAICTWRRATGWCRARSLVPLCRSCALTRTRPSDQ